VNTVKGLTRGDMKDDQSFNLSVSKKKEFIRLSGIPTEFF
jgi:hypothetical protein